MANYGVGGMSSAFQVLEISHTHFWTKVTFFQSWETKNFSAGAKVHNPHQVDHSQINCQDMLENMEYGLAPTSATTTAPGSRDVSPYGSRENLHTALYRTAGSSSLKVPGSQETAAESSWEEESYPDPGRSRSASQEDPPGSTTAEMLRELIQQKKSLLLGRLDSFNSEADSDACR